MIYVLLSSLNYVGFIHVHVQLNIDVVIIVSLIHLFVFCSYRSKLDLRVWIFRFSGLVTRIYANF